MSDLRSTDEVIKALRTSLASKQVQGGGKIIDCCTSSRSGILCFERNAVLQKTVCVQLGLLC